MKLKFNRGFTKRVEPDKKEGEFIMKKNSKIIIGMIAAILVVGGGMGYYYMIANTEQSETTIVPVTTQTIGKVATDMVLDGEVKTKEIHSEYYDYDTYGKLWSTKVSVGQFVKKDDIIVESSKKDFKAPFDGYITTINADSAYNEAKTASDDKRIVTNPEILYTIVSNDLYIETTVNEYEVNKLPETPKVTYAVRADNPDKYYEGTIRAIAATPNPAGAGSDKSTISKYQLTVNMNEGKDIVRVGNHVTIRISDSEYQAPVINKDAVIVENGSYFVFVVQTMSPGVQTIQKTQITTTEVDNGYKLINGLSEGDVIVTKDVTALMDGQMVSTDVATSVAE